MSSLSLSLFEEANIHPRVGLPNFARCLLLAFRASLLVIQSCLIGLNGPPDIPVVLENLPQITAAAYELGLHVEPVGGGGGGEEGQGGQDDADERRALWWRFLELQVCVLRPA